MVRVYVFNRSGELVGPVESPKLELSDEEWRTIMVKVGDSPESLRRLWEMFSVSDEEEGSTS